MTNIKQFFSLAFVLLLFGGFFLSEKAAAQAEITFIVVMNEEIEKQRFNPSNHTLFIEGKVESTTSIIRDEMKPIATGSFSYSATLSFPEHLIGEFFTYTIKVMSNRAILREEMKRSVQIEQNPQVIRLTSFGTIEI